MLLLREQPGDMTVAVVFLQRLIHPLWKKHNLQSAWIPLAVDFLLTYGLRGSRLVKRDCTIQLVLVLTLRYVFRTFRDIPYRLYVVLQRHQIACISNLSAK